MRRPPLLLLPCFLIAAGAVAWLAWGSTVRPPDAAAEAADARTAGGAPAGVAAEGQTPATAERAAPLAAPAAAPAGQVMVQVVDAATGAPVPQARVRSVAADWAAIPRSDWPRYKRDKELLADDHGTELSITSDAMVVLPEPAADTLLMARFQDRYGEFQLDTHRSPPHRLELRADHTLRVRVEDGAGAPVAGVPLALRMTTPTGLRSYPIGEADDRGSLTYPHAQRLHPGLAGIYGAPDTVAVGVDLPGYEQQLAPLELQALPRHEVVLQLGRGGALVVRLLDAAGQPVRQWARVEIDTLAAPDAAEAWRWTERHLPPEAAGEVVVAPVALGRRYRITARINGALFGMGESAGPTREGERITVLVAPERGTQRVTALVLDLDRQPLRTAGVHVELHARGEVHGQYTNTTTEGVALLTTPEAWRGARLELIAARMNTAPWHAGSLPLAVALDGEPQALGSVVLAPPAQLAAGVVVDDGGTAIGGARVWAERRSPAGDWQRAYDLVVEPAAGGHFRVLGDAGVGRLRLGAVHDDFVHEPVQYVELRAGADDLRMALTRAAGLSATVLLPDGYPRRWLRARLQPTDPEHGARAVERSFELRDAARAEALWSGLAAGRYDFALTLLGEATPCRTVRGVQLQPGRTNQDPRLADIDLRDELQRARVTLVGDGGPAPGRRGCLVVRAGERSRAVAFGMRQGLVELPATRDGAVVLVCVDGYRRETVALRRGAQRHVLQPALAVTLETGAAGDDALRVTLVPASPEDPPWVEQHDGLHWPYRGLPFARPKPQGPDATGRIRLRVPAPGAYHVVATRGGAAVPCTPATVSVRDVPAQAFGVRAP